jgi:hypothetical protein
MAQCTSISDSSTIFGFAARYAVKVCRSSPMDFGLFRQWNEGSRIDVHGTKTGAASLQRSLNLDGPGPQNRIEKMLFLGSTGSIAVESQLISASVAHLMRQTEPSCEVLVVYRSNRVAMGMFGNHCA